MFGVAIVVLVGVCASLAPLIAPYDPLAISPDILAAPSAGMTIGEPHDKPPAGAWLRRAVCFWTTEPGNGSRTGR
jgi:hypothetical protein